MKSEIQERFFYSQTVAQHLNRISEKSISLFDTPQNNEGTATIMTTRSKLKSYWGAIRTLQSFIKPSLTKTFYDQTVSARAYLIGSATDHARYFDECQTLLEALQMECHNAGLLLRPSDDMDEMEVGDENAAKD